MKKYIVYCTTNIVNNKIYVGVHGTETPEKFDGYIGNSINIFESNYKLKYPKVPFHKDVKKYGYSAFRRATLQVFDTEEEALNLESKIVNEEFVKREDTYNIVPGISKIPSKKINIVRKIGQYTINGDLVKIFNTLREARKEFPNVSKVLNGLAKHCHNYTFKYIS